MVEDCGLEVEFVCIGVWATDFEGVGLLGLGGDFEIEVYFAV